MGRRKSKADLDSAARLFTDAQIKLYAAHAAGDAEAFEAARSEMQELQQRHAGLRIL